MSVQKLQEKFGVHILTSDVPSSMEVQACFGLVHGQALMGANFIKDFFAKVADTVGGRVRGYESALEAATLDSLEMMVKQAASLGANAIVCVDVKTTFNGKMLMASCAGTAYVLNEKSAQAPAPAPSPAAPRQPRAEAPTRQFSHATPLG